MIEKLFFEGVWECYFRDIQSVSLLDKKAVADNWNKIIVPRRYWCADPFIVNDERIIMFSVSLWIVRYQEGFWE